jgi:hypothetical protein
MGKERKRSVVAMVRAGSPLNWADAGVANPVEMVPFGNGGTFNDVQVTSSWWLKERVCREVPQVQFTQDEKDQMMGDPRTKGIVSDLMEQVNQRKVIIHMDDIYEK